MSSVTASDRNQQTDELRRMREEYENQEATSTKRKNKELRAMNEKHEKELQETREGYEKQLETIRNKHKDIISERDEIHANDSKKLRDMYVGSLAQKATENDHLKHEFKETYRQELDKEKKISAQQRERVERNFRDNLKERDRQSEDYGSRSIEKMKEGLTHRTDKLNEKHELEMKALTEDRERVVGELRTTVDVMRGEFNDRTSADRRLQRAELDRRDAAIETITRNMDHSHNELLKNRDEQLQNSRKDMQGAFLKKSEQEHARMNDLTRQYGEQLDNRTYSVIKNAKAEAARAKNDQVLDMITNRRLRDLEQKNLQSAYQDRFNSLQKEKDEIFDVANSTARERVNKVLDRTDKLLSDTNRKSRMDQNIQNMRNREALATNERAHKDQVETINNSTEKRVRRIMNDTMHAQKEQLRQNDENLDILKGSYSENLQSQREAQLETMKNVYDRMDKKLREQENKLVKRHDESVEALSSKVDELENKRKIDLQKQAETFQSRAKSELKAHNQALQAVELKYKEQASKQEEMHNKDLERLERKHQEQMQAVVARAAATQASNRKS